MALDDLELKTENQTQGVLIDWNSLEGRREEGILAGLLIWLCGLQYAGLTIGLAASLSMAKTAPGLVFVLNAGPSQHPEEEMHSLSGPLKREKIFLFFPQSLQGIFSSSFKGTNWFTWPFPNNWRLALSLRPRSVAWGQCAKRVKQDSLHSLVNKRQQTSGCL